MSCLGLNKALNFTQHCVLGRVIAPRPSPLALHGQDRSGEAAGAGCGAPAAASGKCRGTRGSGQASHGCPSRRRRTSWGRAPTRREGRRSVARRVSGVAECLTARTRTPDPRRRWLAPTELYGQPADFMGARSGSTWLPPPRATLLLPEGREYLCLVSVSGLVTRSRPSIRLQQSHKTHKTHKNKPSKAVHTIVIYAIYAIADA